MAKIKDLPLEERPREKALINGISTLTNAELIALIIASGNKKESALDIANNVLASSGGIEHLRYLTLDDLLKIEGISKAKALSILASIEVHSRTRKGSTKVKVDEKYLVNYFRQEYFEERQEKFYLVLTDLNNNLLYLNTLFIGRENRINVDGKLILSYILKYNAKKFYLIHNHPFGNPFPSDSDIATTEAIDFLSLGVQCTLMDHLVFGKESFYSIRKKQEYQY